MSNVDKSRTAQSGNERGVNKAEVLEVKFNLVRTEDILRMRPVK